MKRLFNRVPLRAGVAVIGLSVLSGCASVDMGQSVKRINDETLGFTQGNLSLVTNDSEKAKLRERAQSLLGKPLSQSQAVEVALVNSPSMQALLAQSWAQAAEAAQSGRIANPVFSFERLRAGDELELGRALSFGLLDLAALPWRQSAASRRIEQAQVKLAAEVVDQVTMVRQAWVRAVAAQQTLKYAEQVYEASQASAELAQRMQAVGNFNRVSRARQQAFYADAATRLASANHLSTAAREELVRILGLNDEQADQLRLPDRLPDLPKEPVSPKAFSQQASQTRLDVRLAKSTFETYAKAQGIELVNSLTDIEVTALRNTTFDNAEGTRTRARGFELALRLPVFDWGGMQRDAFNARTLAAANQLEAVTRSAGSNLRESYSAYRAAHDVARHYRDEVLPLRKVISDENQLRYNGMLIGVFELLADYRDQVETVIAAIDAEQQFWLADAAMQASLIGRPTSTTLSVGGAAPSAGGGH
jgi:outer membrane protein TolC